MNVGDWVRAIVNYSVIHWEINAIRKDVWWVRYDIECDEHNIYTWLYEREVNKEKEKIKEWIGQKIKDLQFVLDSINQ